jgi:alkylation response protein AidB-like acyl-CoA dehydrogenase
VTELKLNRSVPRASAFSLSKVRELKTQGERKMNQRTDEVVSEVRKAAIALGPQIREAADEIEEGRRLPPHIVGAMRQGGIFAIAMPRAWGGSELDLPEQLRVLETLSRFDGSVGWCATIGSAGGFISSWLPDEAARELFHDANAVSAGSALFAAKAVRVEGGYRVSGRWPFNSGCQHATVLISSVHIVDREGELLIRPEGFPEMRMCFMPASKAQVLDTWYSTGLRGSGSHDVEVKDLFVPDSHTASFPDVQPFRRGPLYQHPFTFAYVAPATALGIARHAIEAFIDIANHREITLAALGGQKVLLRMSPHAQVAISRAEGLVRSARSLVYEVVNEIWDTLVRGEPLSNELRASFAVAMTNTHRSCTEAVDLLYKTNGGSSVYARCPLERCFRDIHTVSQHHFTSVAFDEKAGQVILGLEPADQMF